MVNARYEFTIAGVPSASVVDEITEAFQAYLLEHHMTHMDLTPIVSSELDKKPRTLFGFTDKNAHDTMGTACYGGIDYWATAPTNAQREAAPEGTLWVIVDREDDETFHLTIKDLREAFFELLYTNQTLVGGVIHGYIKDAWLGRDEDGIDGGCIDAEAADAIVQVACFGEVLYG